MPGLVAHMKKYPHHYPRTFFFPLLIIFLILSAVTYGQARGWFIPQQPIVEVIDGTITFASLTLEQKIAQMIIVAGYRENSQAWKNMQLGGIHLFALQTEHIFNNTVVDFQYDMTIPFFVTADLEGCISPFGGIRNFTANSQIKTLGEAFEKGFQEGAFLHKLGFNLNFAPVVDLQDSIWKCRSFNGTEQQVAEFAQAYILGLQTQQVIGTAKHYPGKTLVVRDPHKYIVAATIDQADLYPYDYLAENDDVKAIMVSHIITTGAMNSEGLPAVTSTEIILSLKKRFDGLVISDEIHMLGLKNFYNTSDEMYLAVFKAGNDLILNFDKDPNEIHRMIQVIKAAVERGEIPEEQIDASVRKILEMKGFKVE